MKTLTQGEVRDFVLPLLLVEQNVLVGKLIELEVDGFGIDDWEGETVVPDYEFNYRYIIHLDERDEFQAGVYPLTHRGGEEFDVDFDHPLWEVNTVEEMAEETEHYSAVKDDIESIEKMLLARGALDAKQDYRVWDEYDDVDVHYESPEVYEWWVVDDRLEAQLRDAGEIFIHNEYGTWWGRQCTGQAVWLDGVIVQAATNMYNRWHSATIAEEEAAATAATKSV